MLLGFLLTDIVVVTAQKNCHLDAILGDENKLTHIPILTKIIEFVRNIWIVLHIGLDRINTGRRRTQKCVQLLQEKKPARD